MPFKIVSTRRKGKLELCTVPETWEVKGTLRWPKMYGDILAKNDSTQPQTDWLTYNCVVKRRNYHTYEEAEDELEKMLEKTDTDDTDYSEQSYKRTTAPQKVPNLNAAAQRIMIKSGNPKKRMKQPTSTIQASQIIQESPTTQGGPITQAGPTTQAGPITQASPTIPASQTIQAGPFTQAYPTIQIFPETSILTNQQHSYTIDEAVYTVSTEEQENMPQEVHYYTNNQNMTTYINNLYEIQTAILDNQNKIMKKLGEMSVQLQEIQDQSTENITVTTLAQAKGAETKRMRMDVVDNIESMEKLDKELSCPKILKTYLEKYAILCSAAPGSGSNYAYRLLDSIFTKDFLCQCSWTGGSRGDDLKIGFKKYKNILNFFFQMVNYWDNTYTVQDNEDFFKSILRNALKRKTSKKIRQSSKKRRKLQPKRVGENNTNNDGENNTDNDGENNTYNDGENNTNNDGEANINDDGNHNPNDEKS
ncbi:hypothetical protein evm_013394 [Chilo suppressalis]|nr:hypothetical protein evm_013394 [Chilo suppressalis]